MTDQLALVGVATPPGLKLSERQRQSLEMIAERQPMPSDELGACLHELRRAKGGRGHTCDTRCNWCEQEGQAMGAQTCSQPREGDSDARAVGQAVTQPPASEFLRALEPVTVMVWPNPHDRAHGAERQLWDLGAALPALVELVDAAEQVQDSARLLPVQRTDERGVIVAPGTVVYLEVPVHDSLAAALANLRKALGG